MPTYASTSIRLRLSNVSKPQGRLVDEETAERPEIFATQPLTIAFAVFDAYDDVVDLSNISYVEADFVNDPECGEILASSSILAAALTPLIPVAAWLDGTEDQGEIGFTTDQLAALTGRRAWLVVRGLTAAGNVIIFGAGWVNVRPSGAPAAVYLPLSPVPAIIPAGAIYEIPAGVVVIFPTSPQILGELICDPAEGDLPPGAFTIISA